MSSSYKAFKTDPEAEKKGVWVDYGEFRVLLARAGGRNKDYAKVMDDLSRPYRRAIKAETLPDDIADNILMGAFLRTVIKAWEVKQEDGSWASGMEHPETGELLPFNQENAQLLLRALPDLYTDLKMMANNNEIYRQSVREVMSGN